jgi:UDPglucose 6-dehydrogenase
MVDINSAEFGRDFNASDATVGIIGQGFVGGAMRAYFDRSVTHAQGGKFNIVTYDKYKGGDIKDVVDRAELIFVCVPTPMRKSGECHTGIVESVLQDIIDAAELVGRNTNSFVVCVKSTVWPGFIESMRRRHPSLRLTFSPEFLTEKNSVRDMLDSNRVIVGGDLDDAGVVLTFFLTQDSKRVSTGECVLIRVEPTVAEMVKLYTNGILFTKVLFSNEIYQMCQRLGVKYDDVRLVSCVDPRIGSSHTSVPGPDGYLGAGGHCFPKDMHNLKWVAKQMEIPERLFTAVLERNDELREERDWEKMENRAVTND